MANSRSCASTVNTHTLDNAQGEIKTNSVVLEELLQKDDQE